MSIRQGQILVLQQRGPTFADPSPHSRFVFADQSVLRLSLWRHLSGPKEQATSVGARCVFHARLGNSDILDKLRHRRILGVPSPSWAKSLRYARSLRSSTALPSLTREPMETPRWLPLPLENKCNFSTRPEEDVSDRLETYGAVRRATLYIIISALAFAAGGAVARFLGTELPAVTLVFWRNVVSFAALLGWFIIRGIPDLYTNRLPLHCLRAFFSYGALLSYFYTLQQTHLADAVLLQSSSPLFIPVAAFIAFRRVSDRFVWSGTLVGFVGVMLIVAPQGNISFAASGILSGIFGAVATVAVWALSSTELAIQQMFYFSLLALSFSSIPMLWFWKTPSLSHVPLLILLGLSTTLGQYFLSLGCMTASTDKIINWSYTSVVFSAIFGLLFWGEAITMTAAVGIGLVAVGARWTMRTDSAVDDRRLWGWK